MIDLCIGDRVLAASPSGALQYQDVYFFGHLDGEAVAGYVSVATAGGRLLRLTPDHYVPITSQAGGERRVSRPLEWGLAGYVPS